MFGAILVSYWREHCWHPKCSTFCSILFFGKMLTPRPFREKIHQRKIYSKNITWLWRHQFDLSFRISPISQNFFFHRDFPRPQMYSEACSVSFTNIKAPSQSNRIHIRYYHWRDFHLYFAFKRDMCAIFGGFGGCLNNNNRYYRYYMFFSISHTSRPAPFNQHSVAPAFV